MKKIFTIILVVALGWGLFSLYQRGSLSRISTVKVLKTLTTQPTTQKADVEITIETVVQNLKVPWSIVFTSDGRMLVTERGGQIRVVENGSLLDKPLISIPDVSSQSEEGLMGMALDPSYPTNKRFYICFAYRSGSSFKDRVVSLIDNGSGATIENTLIDNIPAATNHAGCRIKFGPDKKLYITTGDATDKQIAQDRSSLGGKILRINSDGSIPSDNPFPESPIWTLGHRNPQGIDWHPGTDVLFETEHGPSGFDGPGGGDEINIIKKGENYGWPIVSHDKTDPRFVSPKLVFTPAVAPAAGLFYSSDVIPQYKNNFFFAALRGEGIYRVILSDQNHEEIVKYEKLDFVNVGRVREIAQGPDGAIYFTTSNQDGRGTIRTGDDKIYRIKPQ